MSDAAMWDDDDLDEEHEPVDFTDFASDVDDDLEQENDDGVPAGPGIDWDLEAAIEAFQALPRGERQLYLDQLNDEQREALSAAGVVLPVSVPVPESLSLVEPGDPEFRPVLQLSKAVVDRGVTDVNNGRLMLDADTTARLDALVSMTSAMPEDDSRYWKGIQQAAAIINGARQAVADAAPVGRVKRTESGMYPDGTSYVDVRYQGGRHERIELEPLTAEQLEQLERQEIGGEDPSFGDLRTLTPADAAEWSPDKWMRFEREHPREAERILGGSLEPSGVRHFTRDRRSHRAIGR